MPSFTHLKGMQVALEQMHVALDKPDYERALAQFNLLRYHGQELLKPITPPKPTPKPKPRPKKDYLLGVKPLTPKNGNK